MTYFVPANFTWGVKVQKSMHSVNFHNTFRDKIYLVSLAICLRWTGRKPYIKYELTYALSVIQTQSDCKSL